MIITLILLFFSSFIVLFAMRKVAFKINLVDTPNARKLHQGSVPLVGGISITLVLAATLILQPQIIQHSWLYLLSIITLAFIGALDDKFDLSVRARIGVQVLLSLIMIHVAGIEMHHLGNILGFGDIYLGWFGTIVTVMAVIGAINAFNMVDGIDGLLGGLSIVTFGALAFLLNMGSPNGVSYLCMVIIATMLPYICMNLGICGRQRKVFMGDAGSMMIGFTVIWMLLGVSQVESRPLIRPVTALWLIAIPLMDMTAIMIRRIRRGDSPFKPDREHLHHIFQRLGLTSLQTLLVICSIASLCAAFGIYGEKANISEAIMFYSFLLCFGVYFMLLSYVWRVTAWVKRLLGKNIGEAVEH